MARYKLLVDCFLDHAYLRHGTIVERPDDWKGPMKAVPALDENKRHIFVNGEQKLVNEPLFELVKDKS